MSWSVAWSKAWYEDMEMVIGLKTLLLEFYQDRNTSCNDFNISLERLNGYVIAQWRFKWSNISGFCFYYLFGCFIPFQVILLPMARTLGVLGILNLAGSIPGLILVHVVYGIGFTTLFFRNFYVSIPVPTELIKAAKIDGANFFRIFWSKFYLPLSLPIIVVTVIWQFTQIWNDFLIWINLFIQEAGSSNQ